MLRSLRYASRSRARIVSDRRTSSLNSTDATHSRSISAPYCLMIFSGSIDVAERLRHRPAFAIERPAVGSALAIRRAALAVATPTSSELWNQPRYWSPPSRYRSAGQGSSVRLSEHRQVARSGIEPHVENVVLLARTRCRRTSDTSCPAASAPPRFARTRCRPSAPRTARRRGRGSCGR